MKRGMIDFSTRHPWVILGATALLTIFFALQFPKITIDTDPQNMLPADEPTRLFHADTKETFSLHDFIAVGVVQTPTAFTADLLNRVYRITEGIEEIEGVIVEDIMAPATVDDIRQGAGGTLVIGPLMAEEIETDEEAAYIHGRILNNPILRGKLASDDGQAIALFVPIESKDMSHRIGNEIQSLIDEFGGDAEYHLAGLPLAENSFGAEMFLQMAYSAPAAMLIIFLLLFLFFRQMKILIAPMIVAMVSVIWAMGLLIFSGFTVHIMSSMIPIFLIPIAVLDSVHILSEFTETYAKLGDKRETIRRAMGDLFMPMLFTSLTTVAGFLSLALTPIPPVRVFGLFVAFGIAVAWLLSMVLNPAVAVLISDSTLKKSKLADSSTGPLAKAMSGIRAIVSGRNRLIIVVTVIVVAFAGYGLSLIVVNDNPVKWFKPSHPIRIADATMNQHLAGTYMNYLVFDGQDDDAMKEPAILAYMESMQRELEQEEIVGSTTGLPDIVKKVRYELFGADSSKLALPETKDEVAQMLFMFEMSGGDPDDLFKFVTPYYNRSNIWVQMQNGDNLAVTGVVERATQFMATNPPPEGVEVKWAGLPYINIEWQHQMVEGMGWSLLSSFGVVFLMMVFLFRSIRWGFVSVLPLSITIMAIYAFIGYIGKPYDMPVAVLSSLTLGLSIDFAIHFIQRLRTIHAETQNFAESFHEIFESTGRAIGRNVLVIAIGFIPMLFSTLMPYITVGTFFLAIMIVSGLTTLMVLPAIAKTFRRSLLPEPAARREAGSKGATPTESPE